MNANEIISTASSSDDVDGSIRTASQCTMLVLFKANKVKEPSTCRLKHFGLI
jgi:hypothetical protein